MSTKKLFDILPDEGIVIKEERRNPVIRGICLDSRMVEKGYLFIALKGLVTDGHHFIDDAISRGAIAVLVENMPENRNENVLFLQYLDRKRITGEVASRFYDHPSTKLKLVGITGTNGKTSCVNFLHQLFGEMGCKTGLISTIQIKVGEKIIPSTHTTPDPVSINRLLAEMVRTGCSHAFMEVSSHAVDQGRISGLYFTGAAFTNITLDHLDYHGTMLNYINAKKKFFDGLDGTSFALSNVDDKNGKTMLQNCPGKKVFFGLQHPCRYKGKILSNTIEGLYMDINGIHAHFSLSGKFNASNLLLVYGVACELGLDPEEVVIHMSKLRNAPGRFEKIVGEKNGITAILDYAHTPDALHNVLGTIAEVKKAPSKVLTVVGCGGDRDKSKRPLMAAIAVQESDLVILTSDNPRSEDPEVIIEEMQKGVPGKLMDKVLKITDRKEAIRTACRLAGRGDVLLVAGKGHEKYQEIKGVKIPFDDKEILIAELLKDI